MREPWPIPVVFSEKTHPRKEVAPRPNTVGTAALCRVRRERLYSALVPKTGSLREMTRQPCNDAVTKPGYVPTQSKGLDPKVQAPAAMAPGLPGWHELRRRVPREQGRVPATLLPCQTSEAW